ncbi:MAG: 6-pyruvoyl trahydropterin synthase family protein [Opitutaceae bacterium]
MITCSKIYHDIPFAHRQHRHSGHCAFVHGHNWSFRFTFGARRPDENGFVVDFGKVRFIRDWLEEQFDHACVFNRDDPLREAIVAAAPKAFKVLLVESCSCEGLAEHVFRAVDPLVRGETGGRVFLVEVEVREDSRNSAAFRPDTPPGRPSTGEPA